MRSSRGANNVCLATDFKAHETERPKNTVAPNRATLGMVMPAPSGADCGGSPDAMPRRWLRLALALEAGALALDVAVSQKSRGPFLRADIVPSPLVALSSEEVERMEGEGGVLF